MPARTRQNAFSATFWEAKIFRNTQNLLLAWSRATRRKMQNRRLKRTWDMRSKSQRLNSRLSRQQYMRARIMRLFCWEWTTPPFTTEIFTKETSGSQRFNFKPNLRRKYWPFFAKMHNGDTFMLKERKNSQTFKFFTFLTAKMTLKFKKEIHKNC